GELRHPGGAPSAGRGIRALRAAGTGCVVIAAAVSILGLMIYLGGNEVAFILLVIGLGVFVLAIGLLAAARHLA
ncbi:MAG: hypothetical protein Q7T71_09955, partial [Herbiconiux sp.]|nr:hypothetical protein [Herbiconiux sp.]